MKKISNKTEDSKESKLLKKKQKKNTQNKNSVEEKVLHDKVDDKKSAYVEYDSSKHFNYVKLIQNFIIIIFIFCIILVIIKVQRGLSDQDSFHSVSLKAYQYVSDKDDAMNKAYDLVSTVNSNNDVLSPTNLNLAKTYLEVTDVDDKYLRINDENLPTPTSMEEVSDEVEDESLKSTAFKIFEKMQGKYQVLNQALYNLCDMNPVLIVREYHYNGWGIIGKYNPEDKTHIKGKRHTYFIHNFSNVNTYFSDGDGNPILEDNNIKDIMSMASVYTYYHDPYNTRTFMNYCNDLFDNSYSYVASISEVYYCSGCMHYDEVISTDSVISHEITLDKITKEHEEQKVPEKLVPYKAGTLTKMKEDSYSVTNGDYNEYVDDIYNGKSVSTNNYCPGHIDLNIFVKVLTLDSKNGLSNIDKNYGNKGANYNKNWHGWELLKLNQARELLYKDWEKEYGISISYIDFVKPLTQEEINFYLSRLDPNLTDNRKKVIETALKSVGKIPYYYGGKTSKPGYETNNFGTKIPSDYKGRCLKGLDCSGWINWVYLTAFNKYIIKSEGTNKLATEGTKITRKDLLPGDIIVRPGVDSHVMMFLEWAPGGKMKVIHENGSVNNVSIGTFDAYYPYYRRIITT